MEAAVWKLEDKWKLTTQEALLLLVGTAFVLVVIIGLCTATLMLKWKGQHQHSSADDDDDDDDHGSVRAVSIIIRRALMRSMRWSEANKWEEPPAAPPLLGWQSHNSVSPVWQRPILMGDKCELPSFSGLILYDEKGHLLEDNNYQGKTPAIHRTTLKDLL